MVFHRLGSLLIFLVWLYHVKGKGKLQDRKYRFEDKILQIKSLVRISV